MKTQLLKNLEVLIQKRFVHRMSKVFKPSSGTPFSYDSEEKQAPLQSKSKQFLLEEGFVDRLFPGSYSCTPLGSRCLDKLIGLIEKHMNEAECQKVQLPLLIPSKLLKQSGRWDLCSDELFKSKDRNEKDLCLAPTHEEIITCLANTRSFVKDYFPLALYQIGPKFRDEKRPRYGLLRMREFIMKDLYTFDETIEAAKLHYQKICDAYEKLFKELDLNVVKVQASTGSIGGKYSHEFHLVSDLGENKLMLCKTCNYGYSCDLPETEQTANCPQCNETLHSQKGFELGHTFYLGTKYSEAFKLLTPSEPKKFMEMGCYGLGVSRILAASVEALSTSKNLRFPKKIAPFMISVVLPKSGSKEEMHGATMFANQLAEQLEIIFPNDVVIDDRTRFTIGRRIEKNVATGIPYVVIVGKKATEDIPKIEIMSVYSNETFVFNHCEALNYFRNEIRC